MRIHDPRLEAKFAGRDVFIVGTGPSMRVFPPAWLASRTTIALNQAWRYWEGRAEAPTLALTVHPELIADYDRAFRAAPGTVPDLLWATKPKPPLAGLQLDDLRHIVFRTSAAFRTLVDRPADTLFLGRGIQQTALDLAARLGAATITLVGVDMTNLGGAHHGHAQHVQFHGLPPHAVYAEYRAWTRKARDLITATWGIPVCTLSPFLGVDDAEEDYAHLCRVAGLAPLPTPTDISTYTRKRTDRP